MKKTTGIAIAAAACALFAAGTVAIVSTPAQAAVKCAGINACKGMGACKTATNACKGMGACKGMSYLETADAAACTAQKGKVFSGDTLPK
jgi:hypothetical protein